MDLLSRDYAIRDICKLMGVSRAGYYKWKKRPPSKRDINREKMIELVRATHENHRTHGYRWVAAYIRINELIDISENYAYKSWVSSQRQNIRYTISHARSGTNIRTSYTPLGKQSTGRGRLSCPT